MIPSSIIFIWLRGIFSLSLVAAVVYVAHEWCERAWRWDSDLGQYFFAPSFGWNEETALLIGAIGLVLLTFMGNVPLQLLLSMTGRAHRNGARLQNSAEPAEVRYLTRPDGSKLRVEFHGPSDALPLVFTHGWGLDSREWNYLKRELASQYRLVLWDEPGLGESTRPANRDYSLENLAGHLNAVLGLVDGPAILVGHSIGGMIILTFCRLFPGALSSGVAGLVLTHTSYTNPVRTTTGGAFLTRVEKPVLMPLMYLTILLSPLLRISNWLSYLNGSMHLSTKFTSFAGTETWEQIDFVARFQVRASPAVLARGMLGMMRYDATNVLPKISVPTLVVAGNQDLVTKPSASEYIKHHIPSALLVTLAPGNHMGLIEHHKEYARVIRSFATGLDAVQLAKAG